MAPKEVTEEHKAKMSQGIAAKKAIKAYLEALELTRPKVGAPRKRSMETLQAELVEIQRQLNGDLDPMSRLELLPKRDAVQARIEEKALVAKVEPLADAFVKWAPWYSEHKGITYGHWRELGVPADVLGKAGISKGS